MIPPKAGSFEQLVGRGSGGIPAKLRTVGRGDRGRLPLSAQGESDRHGSRDDAKTQPAGFDWNTRFDL